MNAEFRARLNLFQQQTCGRLAVPRGQKTKNPAAYWLTGRRRSQGSAYFLAAKMNFAYCDLWFEAELR